MKSKHLLLTLLLAVLVPWAAKGQSVFTYETVNYNNFNPQASPYGGYYAYEYKVFLYDAADVDFSGFVSSIAFNLFEYTEANETNFTLYMKDVPSGTTLNASTTFAEFTNGLTPVYVSQGTPSLTAGWNTTTLTNTFEHQSGNSILLMMRAEGPGYGFNSNSARFVANDNHAWHKHSTSSAPTDPGTNVSGNLYGRVPAIKFTYYDVCPPTWTGSGDSYYISNFSASWSGLTLLDNASSGTENTTTDYYNTKSITVDPGDELSCTITMSSGTESFGFALWVDLDGDGLESADRMFTSSGYFISQYTGTFTIPANTPAGTYRMRILGDYNTAAPSDPCGSYQFGEAEDYKLIVTNSTTCAKPTGLAMVPNSLSGHGVSFSWNYEAGDVFEYSLLIGNVTDPGMVNWNSSTWQAGEDFPAWVNLQPDHDYSFWLRRKCDENVFSTPVCVFFRTPLTPVYLEVSNTTSTTAYVEWQAGGDETMWQVAYKKTTDENWTILPNLVDQTFYTLVDLNQNTEYQVKVRVYYNGQYSDYWTDPVIFTTEPPCDIVNDFTMVSGSETDQGATFTWDDNGGDFTVMAGPMNFYTYFSCYFDGEQIPSDFTHTGNYGFVKAVNENRNCAKSSNGGVANSTADMILEVSLNNPADLSFNAKVSSEVNCDKAYFSIDGEVQSNLNGISGNGDWYAYSYTLSAGTHTLRWYYTKNESNYEYDDCFYVGDIVINRYYVNNWTSFEHVNSPYTVTGLNPDTHYFAKVIRNCNGGEQSDDSFILGFWTLSCLPPTGLEVTSVTTDYVAFTFDSEIGSIYQYCLLKVGLDPAEYENWFEGNTTSPATDTEYSVFYPLNGFELQTEYVIYVRKKCCGNVHSANVTAHFTTLDHCATMPIASLPYTENFDSYTNVPAQGIIPKYLPECWSLINTATDQTLTGCGNADYPTMYGGNSHSSDNHLELMCESYFIPNYITFDAQPQYAILPPIENLNLTKMTLWARADNTLYDPEHPSWYHYDATFKVGVMTDPDDASTFTEVAQFTPTSTNYEQYTLYFAGYSGNGSYIAIKIEPYEAVNQAETYIRSVFIDDVIVERPCPMPTDFAASNITAHTADLSWSGTSYVDAFDVRYRTAAEYGTPVFTEGFENGLGGWTFSSGNESNGLNGVEATRAGIFPEAKHTGDYGFRFSSFQSINNGETFWQHLTSPEFTLSEPGMLKFYYRKTTQYEENLYVGYRNANNEAYTSDVILPTEEWQLYTLELPVDAKKVFFDYFGNFTHYVYLDDITISPVVQPAGEWQYVENIGAWFTTLDELDFETTYEAQVKSDCSDDWSESVSFTTGSCPAVTNLVVTEVGSDYAILNWEGQSDSGWRVYYTDDNNQRYYQIASERPYRVTDLTGGMHYTMEVSSECNVVNSNPFDMTLVATTEITTLDCTAPADVTVSDILHNSATVSWTGESESYDVNYRTAAGDIVSFNQDFENGLNRWTFTSMNAANDIGTNYGAGVYGNANHNGTYGFRFSSNNKKSDAETYDQYLFSPELELSMTGTLKFYFKKTNSDASETLYVGYSTTTNELNAFAWSEDLAPTTEWQEYTLDLPVDVKYVALHYFGNYQYYVFVDDITIGAYDVPAGEWQTIVITNGATTANLTSLTAGTPYDVKVEASCGEESETVTFSTPSPNLKLFVNEGYWNDDSKWDPYGAPTLEQDVEIRANVTIPSGYVATANIIDENYTYDGYTLTIEDGGQLYNNLTVVVTLKKQVTGYGQANANSNKGYVLLTFPSIVGVHIYPDNYETNVRTGVYDFYAWDRLGTNDGKEWINYGPSYEYSMQTEPGYGYLYASQATRELTFQTRVPGNMENRWSIRLYYTEPTNEHAFSNWYLIGNPFACNAYMVDAMNNGSAVPFYKMNAQGDGFEVVTGAAIAPMDGVFYEVPSTAPSNGTNVYFTRTQPVRSRSLNINLSHDNTPNNTVIDNAIIRFDEGQTMGKFSFREGSSKVYIPQENKDYAVANAEGQVGEIPVNFKAEHNGSYTLSFTNEEVTFSYLHLIDNLTGNDVDLLQNPSYSFNAKTTDYESRFKLLFATGSSASSETDSFAFINGMGNLSIFGIEGKATVQIIDMLGHVLSSETFSGSYERKLDVAPGVYMLRLINGSDVRVQKMIVK